MSGNTFGTLFAVTNFGESHGPAIGCVIDGCPPGMALSEADIQPDLDRRRPGTSRHVTQRNEPDQVQILSGVYEGKTTGTPIALLIQNTDQRSKDYGAIAQQFRPGHADFTYWKKYGIRDPRGGGRSSARLTAPMVAAGAVAKKWLAEKYGTVFRGCMTQVGEIEIPFESWEHVPNNPFFAPVADVSRLEAYMDALRKAGDSCGARLRVTRPQRGVSRPQRQRPLRRPGQERRRAPFHPIAMPGEIIRRQRCPRLAARHMEQRLRLMPGRNDQALARAAAARDRPHHAIVARHRQVCRIGQQSQQRDCR